MAMDIRWWLYSFYTHSFNQDFGLVLKRISIDLDIPVFLLALCFPFTTL